jgi:ATP-dependent Clp protease, protease subunit
MYFTSNYRNMNLYLNGEVGYEMNLENIQKNWNDKTTDVYINSIGGDVWAGIAIYNFLKEKQITTHTNGVVASIASIIFLAGKKRIVNQYDDFLIHLPMTSVFGNTQDIDVVKNDLKNIENKLAKIYESETSMTFEMAIEQMKKEEFVTPDWLVENGFANEIYEFKAVAKIINNNQNQKMTEFSDDQKSWFEQFFTKIENALKPKVKNLLVQDGTGTEIDFYELEADATPKVGDKAKVNNENANGEFVMPSGDTYVFESGVLTEIKTAEDVEALKAEIENLKGQLTEKENAITNSASEFENKLQGLRIEFENKLKSDFNYDPKSEPKPINQPKNRVVTL